MPGPPGPPAPPPGSAFWSIEGILGFGRWKIGLWLLTGSETGGSAGEVHDLHAALLIAANSWLPDSCPTPVTSSVSRLVSYGLADVRSDVQFYIVGGGRGESVPVVVSPVIVWHVQARGRGRNGRTFLPGVAFGDTNQYTQLTPGAQSDLQAAAVELQNELATISVGPFGPVQIGVLHRREHGEWVSAASVQPVTGVHVAPTLSHQDRRGLLRTGL